MPTLRSPLELPCGSREPVRITGAIGPAGTAVDVTLADGSIGEGDPDVATTVDASGWVVLPRLMDAHLHLDKTLWSSPWVPHRPSTVIEERFRIELEVLGSLTEIEPPEQRATALLEHLLGNGVTAARSHVDVSSEVGLERAEAMLRVRDHWEGLIDLQLVAFAQHGILRSPGTAELLAEALDAGLDVIGSADPATIDGSRDEHLDALFALAESRGVMVDIHVHEPGDVGALTIGGILDRTEAAGLTGRVAVSHGFCLAQLDPTDRDRLAERMAGLQVSLISNLPGRGMFQPMVALADAGVNVVAASDNIRDCWSPFGKADPLERASLAAHLIGWRTDEDVASSIDLVSANAARCLGMVVPTLASGAPADLTLVAASTVPEAVVAQPPTRVVFRRSRVVATGGVVSDRQLWSGPA